MNAPITLRLARPLAVAVLGLVVSGSVLAQGIAGGGSATYDPMNAFVGMGGPAQFSVFFPPVPPVLGTPLTPYNPTLGWPAPPWEVSDFTGDFFYPSFSSRLEIGDLTRKLSLRIEAYGAKRAAALQALRAKLETVRGADAATRERALAAFAVVQAPLLAQLEAESEDLRADLMSGGTFHETVDWNYTRSWRLNESAFRTVTDGLTARLQVMRAAAYYQKGFTVSQRRLLKEISMELADAIEQQRPDTNSNSGSSDDVGPPTDSNPVFYFSPATSRFRLPPGLPASTRRKISMYEEKKAAIKSDLQTTVSEKDSAIFSLSRTHAAEALAKKQEGEIAALESLADDIRRDLANLPGVFAQPPPPDLPPTIVARMTAWVRERDAMQHSVFVLVEHIKRMVNVQRISYRRLAPVNASATDEPPRRTLTISVSQEDQVDSKLTPVRLLVEKHQDDNRPHALHLETERTAIRADVARFLAGDAPANPALVNSTVDDGFDRLERIEEWAAYQEYREAMFDLGLSPEQRRMLFDGAVRALNIPLPPIERSLRVMRE